jgi:hypothetical protein
MYMLNTRSRLHKMYAAYNDAIAGPAILGKNDARRG